MKIDSLEINYFKGLQSVFLPECGALNVLIGKNNSGKSSILHAIDMVGLALSVQHWNAFQPKIAVKDLFSRSGQFMVKVKYEDDSEIEVQATPEFGPTIQPAPSDQQKFKSVLILPDPGIGLLTRRHKTPKDILNSINARNYNEINSLDILYAIRFYSERGEQGMTQTTYQSLIDEITYYFPDLQEVVSGRTEDDIATLTYSEYGKNLDILYSGTGLKHFLDVLLKITISDANVVLLDEPEMGLHPDLQRRFIGYLKRLSTEKGIQFFLATQSQVLLNYADTLTFFRVTNSRGSREVLPVPKDAIHTLLGDLGLRPSDVFNQDICLLVEGASDVVFFEHIIRVLYRDEFDKVAIAVQQYGGGAAEGIVSGAIDVSNITPAQKYVFWIRDRDAKPGETPASEATKFKNKIEASAFKCHIWAKRKIEYYYPETIHVAAQQGDETKENATRVILHGDQGTKYRNAATGANICVPNGTYLRRLLLDHLTSKDQLDPEIKQIVEETLLPWSQEILG